MHPVEEDKQESFAQPFVENEVIPDISTMTPAVQEINYEEAVPEYVYVPSRESLLMGRFQELDADLKQKVVNSIVEMALIKERKNFSFNYHGLEERFKPEGYQIPESEKNKKNDFDSLSYEYKYWNPAYNHLDVQYIPRIMRSKFQISIWKVDHHGVVKIKDRYFTPESDRHEDQNFNGFKLQMSLDKESILIVEQPQYDAIDKLVIILDAFTLESQGELIIKFKDEQFLKPEDDRYEDNYYNYSTSKYNTADIGNIH